MAGGGSIDIGLARPLLDRGVLYLAQLEHRVWADLRPEQIRAGLVIFNHPIHRLLWLLHSGDALIANVLLQAG